MKNTYQHLPDEDRELGQNSSIQHKPYSIGSNLYNRADNDHYQNRKPQAQQTLCQKFTYYFINSSVIFKILLFFAFLGLGFVFLDIILSSEQEFADLFDSTKPDICSDEGYTSNTLKLAYENSIFSLLKDYKKLKYFNAMDITSRGIDHDHFYIVCDNSWSVLKVSDNLQPLQDTNVQIGEPIHDDSEVSGNESIMYDHRGHAFYILRDSMKLYDISHSEQGRYYSLIEKLHFVSDKDGKNDSYNIIESCPTEYEFSGENRGFQSIEGLYDKNGDLYILGLCLSNYCETGKVGKDAGNGRIIIMKRHDISDKDSITDRYGVVSYKCIWNTFKILDIPSQAYFDNYSSLSVNQDGRIVISSQANSQIWIGYLSNWNEKDQEFDPDKTRLVASDQSSVFNFPRDDECEVVYCNIQGIQWLTDNTLVAVSNQVKKNDKQDFKCLAKDQSVHVFSLPSTI